METYVPLCRYSRIFPIYHAHILKNASFSISIVPVASFTFVQVLHLMVGVREKHSCTWEIKDYLSRPSKEGRYTALQWFLPIKVHES